VSPRDFETEFRRLQVEFEDLRRQIQELKKAPPQVPRD
jgi:hypothetical protein